MGGGESKYVQDQERFVRANIDNYKKVLPEHLSKSQIAGKLRQLYANSDCCSDNKNSYILSHTWVEAKKKYHLHMLVLMNKKDIDDIINFLFMKKMIYI